MIRFVVAFASEAEPIVRRYRMEPSGGVFPCFRSDRAALVLSGVGRTAAAAATAFLHAKTGEETLTPWVNLGIAGHRDLELGALVRAHTVVDAGTGERWFPGRAVSSLLPKAVETVARPELVFRSDAAYDMEASGFYPVALRFSTVELVQSIKIVSDNGKTTAAELTPGKVRELVEHRLEELVRAFDELSELSSELEPVRRERSVARLVEEYGKRWRFTASERRRLERLLSRWGTLDPRSDRGPDSLPSLTSGSLVLDRIDERVRALARERPL